MKKISPFYIALGFAAAIVVAGFVDSHSAPAIGKSQPAVAAANPANASGIVAVGAPAGSSTTPAASSAVLRPDVQAFIEQNYGTSPPMVQALDQFGQSVQDLMLKGNSDQARALADHEGRSVDCVYFVARVLAGTDTNLATNAVDRVRALVLNTPERQAAMQAVNTRLQNYIYAGVPATEERQTCDFQVAANGDVSPNAAAASTPEPVE